MTIRHTVFDDLAREPDIVRPSGEIVVEPQRQLWFPAPVMSSPDPPATGRRNGQVNEDTHHLLHAM
jgi:hypothetical protein